MTLLSMFSLIYSCACSPIVRSQTQKYMSENIESNVIHRIKKAQGNQSMKAGAGKPMHNQN
jgi:hypothetical protein